MPNHDTSRNGGSHIPNNHGPLGYEPSDDWQSPFSSERSIGTLQLFSQFTIQFPRPANWLEQEVPLEDTKLLLISPAADATLVVGAGLIPVNANKQQLLANIAASPVSVLAQNGAHIPVVLSIPTISSIEGVDASHTLNFPGTVPGRLVNMKEAQVPIFKHTTVLSIGDKWVSFETTSWGHRCNPLTEINMMTKLHQGIRIEKHT